MADPEDGSALFNADCNLKFTNAHNELTVQAMIEVRRTEEFVRWLRALKDQQGQARIIVRLRRLEEGNFGDAKSLGDGISELRFTFGPGIASITR